MITLKLNSDKKLSLSSSTKIYQSENKFDKFKIIADKSICGKNINELSLNLYVVNVDKEYLVYPINLNEDDNFYIGYIDVTQDLTAKVQNLRLFIKITKSDDIVGLTNYVVIGINETICGGEEIISREELLKQITEKNDSINQLETDISNKNDVISQLQNQLNSLDVDILELLGVDDNV